MKNEKNTIFKGSQKMIEGYLNIGIKPIDYFDHSYNNTLINERSVELVLGFRYIELTGENLLEVGAVTPYYYKLDHKCLDPTDHKATISSLAEDHDYKNKNVLSISTVEHVGMGDGFGLPEQKDLAFEVLRKIHHESKSCLVSWPIGYNQVLDSAVKDNLEEFQHFFYTKTSKKPKWKLIKDKSGFDSKYDSPFKAGNTVIFITKNLNLRDEA